jgi:hypothetical protein
LFGLHYWRSCCIISQAKTEPALPIALPETEIHLACQTLGIRHAGGDLPPADHLLRYQPRANAWLSGPAIELPEAENSRAWLWATPLPDYQGMMIHVDNMSWTASSNVNPQLRRLTYLWSKEMLSLLVDSDESPYFGGAMDPAGRFMILSTEHTSGQAQAPVVMLEDRQACTAGDCPLAMLAGWPIWSPDGRHTLLVDFRHLTSQIVSAPIFLGDDRATNPRPAGEGRAPFWLDSMRYAFISSTPGSDLYGASVDDPEPRLLLRAADALRLLPGETATPDLSRIMSRPGDDDHLFMLLTVGMQRYLGLIICARTSGG